MIGKIKKVLCPYLIIVSIFIAYRLIRGHGSFFDPGFMWWGGLSYWSFWYIPFVMLLFAVSPLFLAFIESRPGAQWAAFAVTLLFSMALGRHSGNPLLNVFFWSSTYLAGILLAVNYEAFKAMKPLYVQCLFAATFLFLGWCVVTGKYFFQENGNFDVNFTKRFELITLGKILLSVCFIALFLKMPRGKWRPVQWILRLLAKYSFSIFFLHQFAILWFERHPHKAFFDSFNYWQREGFALLGGILVCALCIAVAAPIKKIAGKYSRMIIGA